LLYHGRESYRKNSYVIFYMFYKNMLFLAPVTIYGIYSGFQGQNLFGDWMMQLFNIVFTAFPIVIYGIMDQEYDKETLIKNPKLYEHGPNNFLFRKKLLWQWLAYAIMQSTLIFYSCFSTMKNANEVYGDKLNPIISGKSSDLYLTGSLLYGSIVLISNLKLL
jgi:magnesium-transporting ATPase (P-type)